MSNSLGKALLLPTNLEHYFGCKDDDLILKLKLHNIAVSFYLFEPLLFCWFGSVRFILLSLCVSLFISVSNRAKLILSCSVFVLGRSIDPYGEGSVKGCDRGG